MNPPRVKEIGRRLAFKAGCLAVLGATLAFHGLAADDRSKSSTARPHVLYEGPTSLEGWAVKADTAVDLGGGFPSYTNGTITLPWGSFVGREVNLPAVASIDFDVASPNMKFAVSLWADSPRPIDLTKISTPPPFGSFYALQVFGEGAQLLRVATGSPMTTLGTVSGTGLSKKSSAHVAMRLNRSARSFRVYLDGILLHEWRDPDHMLGSGGCFRIVNQGLRELSISKIVISEWDGQ